MITLNTIDDLESGDKIVLFYSKYCKTCEAEMTILDAKKISYFGICCDDDPNLYIEKFGVDLIPELRIYENGKVVWKKADLLKPEEVEFVLQYCS